jgi:hypothetical protein
VTLVRLQYTHKFGAGAFVCATPLNCKLYPWGLWGWLEGSSRQYGRKNHQIVTKILCLAQLKVKALLSHTNQSASSMPAGVRPFSEADKRVTIELWKAKVIPENIRAQLQMSERGLRMIIAYAKHHPENSIPKKSKNAG